MIIIEEKLNKIRKLKNAKFLYIFDDIKVEIKKYNSSGKQIYRTYQQNKLTDKQDIETLFYLLKENNQLKKFRIYLNDALEENILRNL